MRNNLQLSRRTFEYLACGGVLAGWPRPSRSAQVYGRGGVLLNGSIISHGGLEFEMASPAPNVANDDLVCRETVIAGGELPISPLCVYNALRKTPNADWRVFCLAGKIKSSIYFNDDFTVRKYDVVQGVATYSVDVVRTFRSASHGQAVLYFRCFVYPVIERVVIRFRASHTGFARDVPERVKQPVIEDIDVAVADYVKWPW